MGARAYLVMGMIWGQGMTMMRKIRAMRREVEYDMVLASLYSRCLVFKSLYNLLRIVPCNNNNDD
eukprot:9210777-Ditylum_brightwellii.AAC.1